MKIVLSCDFLLERNHQIEILEMFLSLFKDAEIYTLAHREKALLGPIEMRKIHSTFLSHIVKNQKQFYLNHYLIPGAAKKLFIPCSVDLIINISSGLSHGIKKCKKTKLITYLYEDFTCKEVKKSWRERFFNPFVRRWALEQLRQADYIWVARQGLKETLNTKAPDLALQVLTPFFNVDDYQIFPEKIFPYNYCTVGSAALSLEQAKKIIQLLKIHQLKAIFVGEDEHLAELKGPATEKYFCGQQKCAGELAPILAGAKAHIDLEKKELPLYALKSQGTGRPVIVSSTQNDFVQGPGVYLANTFADIKKLFPLALADTLGHEAKKRRANVMRFHPARFRGAVKKVLDQYTCKY